MKSVFKVILSLTVFVGLYVPTVSGVSAQTRADPVAVMVGVLISKYYQNPTGTNVKGVLKAWEQSVSENDKDQVPPITGFLTGLFIKYPTKIDSFLDDAPSPRMQAIIGNALRLAGQKQKLGVLGRKWGWPPDRITRSATGPTLLASSAVTFTDFDHNWGASFATGEARFVRKIYDAFVRTSENPQIDPDDIVVFANFNRTRRNQDDVRRVAQKYPQQIRLSVIYASVALWAMESNAEQHPFIARAINRWLSEKPTSKATRAYRSFAGQ